jgi:hypothetical protein
MYEALYLVIIILFVTLDTLICCNSTRTCVELPRHMYDEHLVLFIKLNVTCCLSVQGPGK